MFTPPTEWLRLGSLVLDWFSVSGALCLLNPVYMVVNRYSTVQYSTVQYNCVSSTPSKWWSSDPEDLGS